MNINLKSLKKSSILLALALIFSISAPTFAVEGEYLFDILKKPGYRASWEAMFKGEKQVPSWLAKFDKTYDAPTAPCKPLSIDGIEYKPHSVCKAHDCADNFFMMMFAPSGRQAWGVLLTPSQQRFFGNPDKKLKDALIKSKDCN